MRSSKLFIVGLFLCLFLMTGCSNSEEESSVTSNNEKVDTSTMKVKHCSRKASAGSGTEVELNYDLYYTGDILNILHSVEKVMSSSDESLDKYEEAYEKIKVNYDGLKYYDAKIERGDTTVTYDVTINYDKIDINKLLDIEGEEDNIIEDGKAKVDSWLKLAKKLGTTCSDG